MDLVADGDGLRDLGAEMRREMHLTVAIGDQPVRRALGILCERLGTITLQRTAPA